MFNEKIIYYRKKNVLTQEELAQRLSVSRQTITKWESGVISPSLEYLIDLSNIFGVTIDSLIKDDDCLNDLSDQTDCNHLVEFIVKAKKSTYAAKKGKIETNRIDSHTYVFEESKYKYLDSFFGTSDFSGQEVVYENDKVVWSMNYYGNVLHSNFSGDFLKAALLQIDITAPYRGPTYFKKGEYTYICNVLGNVNSFKGNEDIYYQSTKIYECIFHGGLVK